MILILRVGYKNNSCIRETQKNSIEFLVQSVYLIYYYSWSMLTTVHPTLNDHMYDMRPTCVVHVVWHYFIPEPSTPFSQVLWSILWLMWQRDQSTLTRVVLKIEKKRKRRTKIKWKEKMKSIVNDLDTACNGPMTMTPEVYPNSTLW